MPISTNGQKPASPLEDRALGAARPLGRVAMVRGSDSEAREGGGFEAARANGIHGAVDLNGWVGEPVFAVANGKATVATRSDWGKLVKTVVLDHRDGGWPPAHHRGEREQQDHRGPDDAVGGRISRSSHQIP